MEVRLRLLARMRAGVGGGGEGETVSNGGDAGDVADGIGVVDDVLASGTTAPAEVTRDSDADKLCTVVTLGDSQAEPGEERVDGRGDCDVEPMMEMGEVSEGAHDGQRPTTDVTPPRARLNDHGQPRVVVETASQEEPEQGVGRESEAP